MTGPPLAPQELHEHVTHGVVRPDPWAWMARDSPRLLEYLRAERAWYDTSTSHLGSLSSKLLSEMEARVPDLRRSSAWARPHFSYYTRDARNRDYTELVRESRNNSGVTTTDSAAGGVSDDGSADRSAGDAVVILDVNALDQGTGYLELGLSIVSPDENLLAYAVDTTGDEIHTLRFRDLRTGTDLPDVVDRVYYTGAWTADSSAFLYTVPDAAYRPDQVRLHRIGTQPTDDIVVLTEPDRRFEVTVRLSRSEQAILLLSESRDTSEGWYLDPSGADPVPRSLGGRRTGVSYRAEHERAEHGQDAAGSLLLVTDDDAVEFRLVSCPVPGPGGQTHEAWREVRPEHPAERLERVDAFAGHVVASVRRGGARLLRVLPVGDLAGPGVEVVSRYAAGAVRLARNTAYDATAVTVTDQSRTDPPLHAAVSLADGAPTDLHQDVVPGHDPSAYVSEIRTFPAPDGTPVPATLVRHRDTPLDGTAPALLFGYGAYEYTFEPDWEEPLPSLLDRGVIYVHAHVRGGGEVGRRWWLDGRLHAKQHTFTDHVAVADGLARAGLVHPDRIATRGLSAGGLLQAAVLTQRPDRWRAVVAEVPFVDVVTTMLDDTIPLTVNEWDEWGDPRVREDFEAMLAYSPVDNLPPAGERPDLLVTGAVHDPRVMVHEPAKWVAALRASDPAWSPRCLFRVETGAGSHVGPSGRLGHFGYEAEVLAWVLDRLGVSADSAGRTA